MKQLGQDIFPEEYDDSEGKRKHRGEDLPSEECPVMD